MSGDPRILIIDKSALAANLYRLLLSPLGAGLVLRRRFEDSRHDIMRKGAFQLIIVNSNTIGKKFQEVCSQLEEAPGADVPKLFICRGDDSEAELKNRISALVRATLIYKPFHPDEFASTVKRLLAGEAV